MSDHVKVIRAKAKALADMGSHHCAAQLNAAADALGQATKQNSELHKDYRIQIDEIVRCHERIEVLESALRQLLAVKDDHMTACDRTMGDSHPCTCGAIGVRLLLAGDSGK